MLTPIDFTAFNPQSYRCPERSLFVVIGNNSEEWLGAKKDLAKIPALEVHNEYLKASFYNSKDGGMALAVQNLGRGTGSEFRWLAQKHLWSKIKSFGLDDISLYPLEDTSLSQMLMTDFMTNLSSADFSQNQRKFHCINGYSDKKDQMKLELNLSYRKWIDLNPRDMTSVTIGHEMEKFCSQRQDCEFTSLSEKELSEEKMNLLIAVGQASESSPPRLHIARYTPATKSDKDEIFLVGKGITFDTGGLNLKPHEAYINTMKNDMGGASLMWHLFNYLVSNNVERPITVVIPSCENAIDARSMQPGSIIRSHEGKNVIIEHTDAEGRLILADALSYTNKYFAPKRIYTAATLTSGALRQFTNFYTPVHFANDEEEKGILKFAKENGEDFTFWPYREWFMNANSHKAADKTNMGRMPDAAMGSGSSNVAAHFLHSFSKCPIVHFDIFCSTWNWSGDYPGKNYGATGAPFASLSDFFFDIC